MKEATASPKDAALKLALELKNSASAYWTEKEISIIEKLIDALAQPDYRVVKTYHEGKPVYVSQPEQEPVQKRPQNCGSGYCSCIECVMEPEQEPSITKTGCGILTLHLGFDDLPDGTKFYTAPPTRPWVGLTDEEMNDITCGMVKGWVMEQLAQAVEDKLKELNT